MLHFHSITVLTYQHAHLLIYSGLLVPESSFVWNNVRHCFLLCAHIHLAQGKQGFVLCDLGRIKLILSSD